MDNILIMAGLTLTLAVVTTVIVCAPELKIDRYLTRSAAQLEEIAKHL